MNCTKEVINAVKRMSCKNYVTPGFPCPPSFGCVAFARFARMSEVNSQFSVNLNSLFVINESNEMMQFYALRGYCTPGPYFLKTLCIFSKNKATLDKVSNGSDWKCSNELSNITVLFQWRPWL